MVERGGDSDCTVPVVFCESAKRSRGRSGLLVAPVVGRVRTLVMGLKWENSNEWV